MKNSRIFVFTFAALLCAISAAAETDWKAEAQKWKTIAKAYEVKYGWINDQYGWCSTNKGISTYGDYNEPNCPKPMKPWCATSYEGCQEWEIQNYKSDFAQWVECRKEYIREAQEDAGCALLKIRNGIERAVAGE